MSGESKTEPAAAAAPRSGPAADVGRRAGRPHRPGILSEYLYFIRNYKMWWLVPVFLLILVLGFVVVLGGSQAALLFYALF